MANQPPAHRIRLGSIRAAIWENRTEDGATWYSVTLSRTFNDGSGPKDSYSFRRDDLPIVTKAADMAYAWIWEQNQAAPSSTQPLGDEAEDHL